MKRSIISIGLAIVCVAALSGCPSGPCTMSTLPDDVTKRLDDTIAEKIDGMDLPGVAVGIWVPGEGQYVTVSGTANLDTEAQRRRYDRFRIASITKTFTATAVLEAADEGFLKTSDLLSKYLPEFHNADKITVRDLLRMRSGIPDYADDEFLARLYADPLMQVPVAEQIAMADAKRDEFKEPDTETVYTNVNYTILGEIVRITTGDDIGKRIEEHVLQPLRMRHSRYPYDTELGGRLRGYSWNETDSRFEDMTVLNPLWAGAGGGMISTLDDLRIFARALYQGDLLKAETQAARLECEPFEGSGGLAQYGEGIAKIGKFWGHDGTIFGFSTEMWYLPEKDAVIVINVNRLDLDDHSKSGILFAALTKIVFPDLVDW